MKIQISYSGIGPMVFMTRLAKYLSKHYDVEIVKERPDIYFSSVWAGSSPKNCKRVHRVDGCYFDKSRPGIGAMNKRIISAIDRSDMTIFQSKYCKKLCRGILGTRPKKSETIHNGFDSSLYDGIEIDKMGYNKMFVACAKWRPLKRPRSIAKGFLKAEIPNSILIMIGDISRKDKIENDRIKYVGQIRAKHTYQYYKSCDAVVHISRLDACPNVVIEGLSAKKPIICNNVGGTPEIVKDDGIILEIDEPLKYKLFKMKKPDSVKSRIIANGLRRCVEKDWDIYRSDLEMYNCAKKYYECFKKVLS